MHCSFITNADFPMQESRPCCEHYQEPNRKFLLSLVSSALGEFVYICRRVIVTMICEKLKLLELSKLIKQHTCLQTIFANLMSSKTLSWQIVINMTYTISYLAK